MPIATDQHLATAGVTAGVEVGVVGEADALRIKEDVTATATAGSGIKRAAAGNEIARCTGSSRCVWRGRDGRCRNADANVAAAGITGSGEESAEQHDAATADVDEAAGAGAATGVELAADLRLLGLQQDTAGGGGDVLLCLGQCLGRDQAVAVLGEERGVECDETACAVGFEAAGVGDALAGVDNDLTTPGAVGFKTTGIDEFVGADADLPALA